MQPEEQIIWWGGGGVTVDVTKVDQFNLTDKYVIQIEDTPILNHDPYDILLHFFKNYDNLYKLRERPVLNMLKMLTMVNKPYKITDINGTNDDRISCSINGIDVSINTVSGKKNGDTGYSLISPVSFADIGEAKNIFKLVKYVSSKK
jgi:hypothetical protein